MKYKRTQKRSKQMWQRVEKFSIRKFSFGAASCLIGAQFTMLSGINTADAAMVTTRNDKGVVTLYANRGDSPYDADAIAVHDSINVDREIVVDVDWSSYSKTNPYVTVTYKYNGGFGASNYVANYGGSRPDYWFTTPVGAQEPSEIRLQTGTTDRVMKSWSADAPWVSFTNSVGSRYQTKDQVDSMGLGDDTKWERYNDTTQESGKTFRGDMAGMFSHRIGTQISDSPSDQGIFESFRTNTKSIYSDWDLARNDRVTITAKYKVADPTLKNGRRTLDFGAGVKVGRALQQLRHFKVVTTEIPVLYQDKELFEPVLPERIGVVDTAKLTAEEKTQLKNKIWEKNQDTTSDAIPEHSHNKFIENVKEGDDGTASANSSISIADDGTATITYGDGTQDVIPGTSLVYEKPQIDNIETTPAHVGDYKYLKNPHAVDNINNITASDIESARQKFFQVNGMKTTKNEDNDDVITAVGDPSKTSQDFVGTNLEYDPRTQGFAILRNSQPTGTVIPKADLFKAKPTKVFSAAEAIEKGKQAIDNLTYLSPKEKEYYKNQLTGKTTQDDINNVVNAAIAKNSENEKAIEAKKRQVKDKINSAKYLTEAEKEALRKQVDSQGIEDPANGNGTGTQAADYTKELLDKIGQQADAKNLENAKKSTKEKIDQIKDSLKNPTADEYKTQIDGKTTVAEVEKVLEEAEKQKSQNEAQKAQEEAEKLKEAYKEKIDQIPGLTEAEKEEYKKQIDQAKSKDQLDTILNDAKAQATRGKAKQTIEELPHLNKAQKDELKAKVDNASDESEVDNIVSIAQGLDSKMDSLQKLVAEAEKVKASDKYTNPNVPQDKKTAFDKAKDAASKVADKNTAAPENAVGTSEVATLIDNLAKAIKELTGQDVAVPVSKDALKAEIDLNKDDAVKKSPAYAKETDAAKKKAYDDALAKAQEVYAKKDATQPQVDEALDKLQQARLALSGKAEDFTLAVTEAAEISVEPTVGAELPEADKDAVKAKVRANGEALKATDTVTYGTITEKDGKKVVPVIVTRDGVSKTINVEVTKKAEELTLAVKDETKPAKISKVPVAGESLTAEDQAKVKEKVTANGEALKDTDTVKYGTIAEKDGKKVVPVTVTRNGVEKTVDVPVEGTDAAKSPLNDPEKVKVNDVSNLSEDEKAAVKAAVKKANTNLTDDQISVDSTGKVTVTYSDKSQNELPASKTVEAKTEAEKALDKAKEKAKADLTEAANKEKAEIEADKDLTDQQKADKKAEVDKVKKEQEANIDKATTPEEVAKATEDGKKAIDAVHQTELDKAKEKAKADLTEAANKEKAEIEADKNLTDQQKADKKAEVDKVKKAQEANIEKAQTTDEVAKATEAGKKAIDEVHQTDADKSTPTVTAGEVPVSVDPSKDKKVAEADKKAITDAVIVPEGQPQPTDKQVKNDGAIVDGTGANAGKKVVVVEVTYPDGSKDEIEVPVRKATDKEKAKADLTDAANTEKGEIGGDTTLTDKEKEDLKAKVDEVKKAAEEKINNAKTSEEIAKATEEGKKAIADVYNPQTAKGQSTNVFKPELDLQTALVSGKVTVEKGKDLTDEEILKQLALADGVTAKVISKPTTNETGTKEAEVEVTLADGNKVTVKVPVEVVDSLDTADKDNDLAKAKEDAKKQVEEAAKAKITEIKKDTGLTEEQKQKAEEAINKAKDEANKAIDEASSAGTAKQIADQAKENIEKYDPKADTEVKKPDVTNLDEEKAKAKAEILEEAQKRIDEIKNNKDLSDEAKQKAIEEINKAKDKAIEDINKGQSKDEINAAKEAGIHKINEVQPEGSIASKFEPKVPENKVEVENPAKLSDEEREQVRQNIEGANTFPDGTTVEVKPDGTAVITYKDGSSDTISKDKLVTPAKEETGTIASRTEPVIPGKTQVGNTTKLTPEEQAAVKKAVEGANNFPAGTTVEVRPDGTVVITYPDKSVDTITGDKLVEKGSKQETPEVQTDAEKNPAQIPGNFVPVENTHNLTQAEQDTVAAKVKEANPAATDVKVSKDGTATLTYSDGSVNTIPGTSLVVAKDTENEVTTQAAQNPAVVPATTTEVGNAHSLTPEEQAAVTAKVQAANPAATAVKVSKDGTATLTYSDGSVNTIPGTSLVVQKEETSTQEQPTIAEKTKVIIPATPTKVVEATRLTDAEKEAVKKAVVEANGFGSDVNVEVAGDGTATIVFKDGSAITIPGNQLVAQDPKAQDSTKPTAEKSTVKAPAQRVDVKDITHLTDEEKEKVKVAILQANGSALDGATINVAGDGTATITFPDGSVVTILGKDTVQQSAKGESVTQEQKPESTPGGDNGGNTGSSDANANAGGGSQAGGQAHTGSQTPAQSQASKQLANAKESAKNVIEKAAKDKQDEINGAPLSDKEKAELLARVEAEKQAALKEIENAKTVEDVTEAETIGVQAIVMVTVPKKPVAPNAAAPQATSAPQATAGTMQDVTYQSPAGKQLPNTGSASSAALASLGLVAATSGFALLGRKARRRE